MTRFVSLRFREAALSDAQPLFPRCQAMPGKIVETWDALLHMQKQGKIRSIGVSNFGVQHLEALKQHGRPMPTVNQIEMHPMIYQDLKVSSFTVLS